MHKLEDWFVRNFTQLADTPCTLLLSGGGDSVALFHLLRAWGGQFRALHFFHDGDWAFASQSKRFCEELCHSVGVDLEVVEIFGKPLLEKSDLSWEAICSRLRYAHLKSQKGVFLTAHTADDQAETVVMRMLAGAGLAGLGGIREVRKDGVIRPLLPCTRASLKSYLTDLGQGWVEDPTNRDGNQRAIVRHQLIPVLSAHYPNLNQTLCRTAKRLQEDEDYLSDVAQTWFAENTLAGGDHWSLPLLQSLPRAVLIRVLRIIWKLASTEVYRPRATLFEEAIRLILNGANERTVNFPGNWSLVVLGCQLWLRYGLQPVPSEPLLTMEKETPAFDWQALDGSWRLSSVPIPDSAPWYAPIGSEVRCRRPGDRWNGKCVKKLLAGTTHPPWVRDRFPLLAQGDRVLALWDHPYPNSSPPNLWISFSPSRLRGGGLK